MFGYWISKEGDILDLAANVGIISKSGAWYAYEGDKIGQGRENAKTYLRENPEFCKMIEEMVREHYFAQEDEAPESEPVRNPRKEMMPATTLWIPKSSTPSVFRTMREVYRLISTRNNIRTYSNTVFIAIRLLEESDIRSSLGTLRRYLSHTCPSGQIIRYAR